MIGGERAENNGQRLGSYHDAVWMIASVPREFFSTAETRGTDVDAVAGLAGRIRTFDSDRVGEIAATAVAFDLETRLRYGCSRASAVEISEEKWTDSGFPQVAGAVSSCE